MLIGQGNEALWMLAVVAVVGLAIFAYLRRNNRADISIVVDGADVRFSGAVPQAKQAVIAQFLIEDMELTQRVTIRGRRVPQGWRFAVNGPLPQGDQQRIRNFLLTTL